MKNHRKIYLALVFFLGALFNTQQLSAQSFFVPPPIGVTPYPVINSSPYTIDAIWEIWNGTAFVPAGSFQLAPLVTLEIPYFSQLAVLQILRLI
jgi:hypothetical protein